MVKQIEKDEFMEDDFENYVLEKSKINLES